MNPVLKQKLKDIANEFSEEGIEAMEYLTPVDFEILERLLNDELKPELSDKDHLEIVQLRYLFRIWANYGDHISKGLALLYKQQT